MQAPSPFGTQLRHWRRVRGISQLDLAVQARTTARHVSFLETGRSRPGPGIVHRLAKVLDVPLRGRNDLLCAAGLPPDIPERELSAPGMEPVRRVVERLLASHEPFPGIAHDHRYEIVAVNSGAARLFGVDPGTDLIEVMLGPGPMREVVIDWPGWAWATVDRIRREAATAGADAERQALLDRALALLADVPRPTGGPDGNDPVWCPTFARGGERVRTLSTVAHFHNARDVTVDELRVELIYPYDAASEAVLRRWLGA